jgi:hypothetical protein
VSAETRETGRVLGAARGELLVRGKGGRWAPPGHGRASSRRLEPQRAAQSEILIAGLVEGQLLRQQSTFTAAIYARVDQAGAACPSRDSSMSCSSIAATSPARRPSRASTISTAKSRRPVFVRRSQLACRADRPRAASSASTLLEVDAGELVASGGLAVAVADSGAVRSAWV